MDARKLSVRLLHEHTHMHTQGVQLLFFYRKSVFPQMRLVVFLKYTDVRLHLETLEVKLQLWLRGNEGAGLEWLATHTHTPPLPSLSSIYEAVRSTFGGTALVLPPCL